MGWTVPTQSNPYDLTMSNATVGYSSAIAGPNGSNVIMQSQACGIVPQSSGITQTSAGYTVTLAMYFQPGFYSAALIPPGWFRRGWRWA